MNDKNHHHQDQHHHNHLILEIHFKYHLIFITTAKEMDRKKHMIKDDIRSYLSMYCQHSPQEIHNKFLSEEASVHDVKESFIHHLKGRM